MHTTEILNTDEGRTYIDTIPFLRDRGLVRIVNTFCRGSVKPNLSIERNEENRVKIRADIVSSEVQILDSSYDKQNLLQYGWKPWWTDVICSINDYKKLHRNDSVRGDNRLLIDIREPGDYHVTIPNDCDILVDLQIGNIKYLTPPDNGEQIDDTNRVNTSLHIQGNSVNMCGDCGSSIPGGYQNWNYFWGNDNDPHTKLETKLGHVTVPTTASNCQETSAHRSVWEMSCGQSS